MTSRKIAGRPIKDIIVACLFGMVCIVLVLSAIWSFHTFRTTPPYVNHDKYPIRGIDVSSHNGKIDFNKVAEDGIEFVFIKATEGIDFRDQNFNTNYENAKIAGLKTGVYHFFKFNRDGVEQATNFVRSLGSLKPDLPLVIDVEKAGNSSEIDTDLIKKRLFSMVDYLNLLGFRVMFYTNYEGYYEYLADTFPGYPLWICRFKENPINAEWTFWQYNHRGKINGIKGDTDLDVFCGNREEWEAFLNGAVWPYSETPKKSGLKH